MVWLSRFGMNVGSFFVEAQIMWFIVKFSSGMITKNFDANNSLESAGNVRIFEHLCIVLVFLIATVKGASTDWNFTLICFVNLI